MGLGDIAPSLAGLEGIAELCLPIQGGFWCPTRNPQLQSFRGNEICGGGLFSKIEWIFITQINDTGTQFDCWGLCSHGSKYWKRRGYHPLKMVHTKPGTIKKLFQSR